jgi:hypothetical protein
MRRLIVGLLALLFLSSCAPVNLAEMQRNIGLAAQQQLQRMLAAQFTRRFTDGIDYVVGTLQQTGGFLDNPLVRILLPPPMGLVLGIVRDVREAPDAALLEVLMNRAAEAAIPGAGPILKSTLTSLAMGEMEAVLAGGRSAATELLETRTRTALQEALAPVIAETLADSGADEVYERMLQLYEIKRGVETGVLMDEPQRDLGAYVTERAVDGVFTRLAREEQRVRDELDRLAQGWLPAAG